MSFSELMPGCNSTSSVLIAPKVLKFIILRVFKITKSLLPASVFAIWLYFLGLLLCLWP